MNKAKLAKEGAKWVKDGLITEEQLQAILSKYELKDYRYLLILCATLFISIGILIYALSDWTQVSNFTRVSIMIVSMIILYSLGNYYYKEDDQQPAVYPQIVSISFLLLGYVFFGASLLLLIHLYDVILLFAWPYTIWGLLGLVLYFFYPERWIALSGISVIIIVQLYSSLAIYEFSITLFVVFLIGYGFVAYKQNDMIISSTLAIGFVIQSIIATNNIMNEYYWLLFYLFIMYVISEFIPKQTIKLAFFYTTIFSAFMYKTVETFMLQEESFLENLTYEYSFLTFIGLGMFVMVIYIVTTKNANKLIHLSLFIPLFFLPFSYVFVILSMFIYALFNLIYGFQKKLQSNIMLGIITFLLSTFTAYVQYAWDVLNKSLFFIIGGLLLFVISFVLEKVRRKREQGETS